MAKKPVFKIIINSNMLISCRCRHSWSSREWITCSFTTMAAFISITQDYWYFCHCLLFRARYVSTSL